jgi:hypothetical protein
VAAIVDAVINGANGEPGVKAGGSVELHDTSKNSVDAIATIVAELRVQKGLEPGKFVPTTVGTRGPFDDMQAKWFCGVAPYPS